MSDKSETAIPQKAVETLIEEWRMAAEDERGERPARFAYREAADELQHNLEKAGDTEHAYLLSLTDEQLDQLLNDDIAVVDTHREKFVFVRKDHESEAIDHLHAVDIEVSVQEVTARD